MTIGLARISAGRPSAIFYRGRIYVTSLKALEIYGN